MHALTEPEYRALPLDSSSSIKEFAESRHKYYKKFILKKDEEEEEEEGKAARMGNLVDCLLLEPEQFDHRYHLSTCPAPPTGMMLSFTEKLYSLTLEAAPSGILTRDMGSLMEEAYNLVKFDGEGNVVAFKRDSFAKVVERFRVEGESYYHEIRTVRPRGLCLVSQKELEIADRIIDELKTHDFTYKVINQRTTEDITVINQLKVPYFEINGFPLKAMMDKVVVNHRKKEVRPYDLKCVWSVDGFYEKYYLFRKAYIQAFIYTHALRCGAADLGRDYTGYTIHPLSFIVCDSYSVQAPLIYELGEEDLQDAWKGFGHKQATYRGLKDLLEELKWHRENDLWKASRTAYAAGGVINIKDKR